MYARVYQTTNTAPVAVWPSSGITLNNPLDVQTNPVYADVQAVLYSTNYVYVKSADLTSLRMGPWYNAQGTVNGIWPQNQGVTAKIPRFPVPIATPNLVSSQVQQGPVGALVNGVVIANLGDGDCYSTAQGKDVGNAAKLFPGNQTNVWIRNAPLAEAATLDSGYGHPAPYPNAGYHHHANPRAIRYQLGDNIFYNVTNNTYAEAVTNPHHSPIIGWMFDGYPIYGPYGYDSGLANISNGAVVSVTPSVAGAGITYQTAPAITFTGGGGSGASVTAVVSDGVLTAVQMVNGGIGYTSPPIVTIYGVRRMVSGHVARDGSYGTANVNTAGRHSLAPWAALFHTFTTTIGTNDYQLTSSSYGPAVTTGFPMGWYAEDFDFLGDRINPATGTNYQQGVDYDLDKPNGRWCVTPDYPNGTYAYFVPIDTNGAPAFPYTIGRYWYGTNSGGHIPNGNISQTVTTYFLGGTNLQEVLQTPSVNNSSGTVTLTWSSVEGGTYVVEATTNLANSTWTAVTTLSAATNAIQTTATDTGAALTNPAQFYRTIRTAVAPFSQ